MPGLSIKDDVTLGPTQAYGSRNIQEMTGHTKDELVEHYLTKVGLWEEVKDCLSSQSSTLSGGQQQHLCIARALMMEPAVLLMDEPTSKLDPGATACIEDIIQQLTHDTTILIVTHNMQQAARISDYTAFFSMPDISATEFQPAELIEYGPTRQVFLTPKDPRTEAFITGKFG